MKLSNIKEILPTLDNVEFQLEASENKDFYFFQSDAHIFV